MEIARWIYHLPITMVELVQLRGPLRMEFVKCIELKSCSAKILNILKAIHTRMIE